MFRPGCSRTCDVRVLLHGLEVGRVRIRHHVAFALLELRPADRCVRSDGEHEVVDLRLAVPVLRERLVADDGVLLVLDEGERTGADRLLVDLLGRAGLQHGVGIFLRLDRRAHSMARFDEERRLGLVERDLDRVIIDLLDRLQQLGHAHVAEIGVVRARDLEVRVVLLPLTLEHEHDVVGVHVAGRLEVLVGMPLGVLAEMEGVDRAVGRDVPLLGEAGDDLGAAALEVDDVVVDLFAWRRRRCRWC